MRLFIEFSSIESAMAALESLKGFEVVRKDEGTLPDDAVQVLPVQPAMSIQTAPVQPQTPVFETAPQHIHPAPVPVNYTTAPVQNPVPQSPIPPSGFYTPEQQVAPQMQMQQQQVPQMQPQQVAPQVQQQAAPIPTVPTEAPTYTMEQLAVAATQIADAGRRQELVNLLNGFGVQALTQLPKEHYGAFATQLRTMGARI